jgi:hypothetical protein
LLWRFTTTLSKNLDLGKFFLGIWWNFTSNVCSGELSGHLNRGPVVFIKKKKKIISYNFLLENI